MIDCANQVRDVPIVSRPLVTHGGAATEHAHSIETCNRGASAHAVPLSLALDPCLIYDTDEGMAAGSGTSLHYPEPDWQAFCAQPHCAGANNSVSISHQHMSSIQNTITLTVFDF